jgi:hypothetical protein
MSFGFGRKSADIRGACDQCSRFYKHLFNHNRKEFMAQTYYSHEAKSSASFGNQVQAENAPVQSPSERAIDRLFKEIEHAHIVLSDLEKHIRPVVAEKTETRADNAAFAQVEPYPHGSAPLTLQILRAGDRIRELSDRLRYSLDNIET